MASSTDFSILARVVLDVSDIQKQLNNAAKNIKDVSIKVNADGVSAAQSGLSGVASSLGDVDRAANDGMLTWQQYREMIDVATDAIKSFAEQTYEVDAALTELKKVSDLQGESLNKYVQGLTAAGKDVARTGKPNRSEPE